MPPKTIIFQSEKLIYQYTRPLYNETKKRTGAQVPRVPEELRNHTGAELAHQKTAQNDKALETMTDITESDSIKLTEKDFFYSEKNQEIWIACGSSVKDKIIQQILQNQKDAQEWRSSEFRNHAYNLQELVRRVRSLPESDLKAELLKGLYRDASDYWLNAVNPIQSQHNKLVDVIQSKITELNERINLFHTQIGKTINPILIQEYETEITKMLPLFDTLQNLLKESEK